MQDIHCDDFDESDQKEYWFIRYNEPPLKFLKANVISVQEQAPPDPKFLELLEAEMKKKRALDRKRGLRYDAR